jgi:hypothetical protein
MVGRIITHMSSLLSLTRSPGPGKTVPGLQF